MAECAGLENRCVRKGTEGSNPSLSADFCSVLCVQVALIAGERFFRNLLVYTANSPITPCFGVVTPTENGFFRSQAADVINYVNRFGSEPDDFQIFGKSLDSRCSM